MQEIEFYDRILGLTAPWFVSEVKLDTEACQVDVFVEHPSGTSFCCPECGESCAVYDHTAERQWRHLDTMQFRTILHAKPPRIKCPEHGVKQATLPWALKNSRFTMLFEQVAIDVLLATQTVKGAQQILGTSWDETWHILKRAVARGQSRKSADSKPRIGIDEKAFRKGHNYITLLYDLDNSTVEAIADGNSTESANACFSQLSDEQLESVEAIAMDMSAAFVRSARENVPDADQKIVHDRFHVMALLSEAVDRVRRAEQKDRASLQSEYLKGTRYLWLIGFERLTESQRAILDELLNRQLDTAKAWSFKEQLRDLWNTPDVATATAFFNYWYEKVIDTNLKPLIAVANAIEKRLANVVSYCNHGITNAVAEGINSKIMAIKRRVGGYRNRENFKTAIYFYCGGLDLYPH